MLITKEVRVRWNPTTKNHYISKGYKELKHNELFVVPVEDLPDGSHVKIEASCDGCGNIKTMQYREYLQYYTEKYGYLCKKCSVQKAIDTQVERYGGVGLQAKEIKEKAKATNIIKYGCETPFENKEIYEKIRKTQNEKYGGIGMASEKTRSKIETTNLKIRGVRNPSQAEDIKKKKSETCLKNYGVEHIFQDKERFAEILEKSRKTILANGNGKTSNMEKSVVDMLIEIYGEKNCDPSKLVGSLTFDCLLTVGNDKIDVEYDGWYWHKDNVDADRRRNYKVLGLGYKVLRIKSKYKLPTKEQIIEAVNYLTIENHHYNEILLDF